jgi:hypothetical protein
MVFAGKWLELENIMLSEISQFRKTKVMCFLSYIEDLSKKINVYTKPNMIIYIFI